MSEVIEMLMTFFDRVGLTCTSLTSTLSGHNARQLPAAGYVQKLRTALENVKDKLGADISARMQRIPLRVLDRNWKLAGHYRHASRASPIIFATTAKRTMVGGEAPAQNARGDLPRELAAGRRADYYMRHV